MFLPHRTVVPAIFGRSQQGNFCLVPIPDHQALTREELMYGAVFCSLGFAVSCMRVRFSVAAQFLATWGSIFLGLTEEWSATFCPSAALQESTHCVVVLIGRIRVPSTDLLIWSVGFLLF